ncbi:hypothetical protein ACHAXN_008782 [Cyclotella atomus]
MNAIFGNGGWSSQIISEKCIQDEKDDRGRWWIGYLVTVRITLLNGSSHEDCGSGEGINPSKIQAHDKALKSAVTDAMKRAARHFGERLGNALYVKGNGIRTAPKTNKEALEVLERSDQLNLFGDQVLLRDRYKTEEAQHDVMLANENATLPGMNQPPTPIISTAARQATTYNPVAAMQPQHPPTPVVSTFNAPRQSISNNTETSAPANHYASYKPTTAAAVAPSVQTNHNTSHQNQYASNARPSALPTAAAPQNQAHTTTMQHMTNIVNQNATTNNVYSNPGKMPPPQDLRGISPETTTGSVSDASKRGLPAVPVRNSLGNSSVPIEDGNTNKRQKMNPYSTNRLSC